MSFTVASRIYNRSSALLMKLRGACYTILIRRTGGQCGSGLRVGPRVSFKYLPHHGYKIGKNVLWGKDIVIDVPPGGSLVIGDYVSFTANAYIAAMQAITIGSNVLVGEYVSLRDADHGIVGGEIMRLQPMYSEPIEIGNDVWIGRGAIVLKGTKLNDGVVIGANAVVTAEAPANAIMVGIPARLLRFRRQEEYIAAA